MDKNIICNTCYSGYNPEFKDETEVCPACRHKLNKYGTIDIKPTGRIYSFICNKCGDEYYSAREGVVCDVCKALIEMTPKATRKKTVRHVDVETGDRVIVVKAKQYVCSKCGSQYKTWYRPGLGLCASCRVERNRQQARDRYRDNAQYAAAVRERYYHSQEHQDARVAIKEKMKRNEDIYWQRMNKVDVSLLAEQYGISERTVQRINAEMKKHYERKGR